MIDLADFCQTAQQSLADIAGANYPALKRERYGTIDSMISEQNTSGFEQIRTDTRDGKDRQVIVEYIQPGVIDDTSDVPASACDAGTEVANLQQLVNITRYRRSEILSFSKAEMRKLCEAPAQRKAMVLMSRMNSLVRMINRDLITLFNTNAGNFYDGSLPGAKTFNLLHQDAGGRISADQDGEALMSQEFDDLGFGGRPIVVGAGILNRYAKHARIGCCNMWGQQQDMAGSTFDYFYDKEVDIVLGSSDNAFAYVPGSVQLLRHLDNLGDFAENHEHYVETTIIDPFSGLEFDFEAVYDTCDKVYKMFAYLNFDFWFMPDTVYQATDDKFGTNNTLVFKTGIS